MPGQLANGQNTSSQSDVGERRNRKERKAVDWRVAGATRYAAVVQRSLFLLERHAAKPRRTCILCRSIVVGKDFRSCVK